MIRHAKKKPQARTKVVSKATKLARIRVNNTYKCCIPPCKVKLDEDGYNPEISGNGNGKWKKEKHPQPKILCHAHWKIIGGVRVKIKSELRGTEPIKDWTVEKKIDWHVDLNMQKWEKRNPRPVADNDLFKEEFLKEWEQRREEERKRIRDFAVSRYDSIFIVARKTKDGHLQEWNVSKLKCGIVDLHDPNLESTKLYADACKIAAKAMKEDHSILQCTLKNSNKTKMLAFAA